MGISVYRLVRLAKEGDHFSKDTVVRELRTDVKMDDDFVKDYNKAWKTTGQMYVLDKKLTGERDKKLNPEPKKETKQETKQVKEDK